MIRTTTPQDLVKRLRLTKKIPAKVKVIVYGGCLGFGPAHQFNADVSLYNLWEAILYLESYENSTPPLVAKGTAQKCIDALMPKAAKATP